MSEKSIAIISACLMGFNCRYNCKNSLSQHLHIFLKKHYLIPLCPEQLGGLPTPRDKSQITNGDGNWVIHNIADVISITGKNVTDNFLKGAEEVLKFAKSFNIKNAYLKEKSPSCGVNLIYVNNTLSKGMGVTAALLSQNGINIFGVDS